MHACVRSVVQPYLARIQKQPRTIALCHNEPARCERDFTRALRGLEAEVRLEQLYERRTSDGRHNKQEPLSSDSRPAGPKH